MRLFVDTEFTDFIDCDLISLAVVAAGGREFYGERWDYDRASCSEFVRAAILPQLGRHQGCVYTREGLRAALLAWLGQFGSEPERLLCFDDGGDWGLLCDLLDGPPSGWQAVQVSGIIDFELRERYYQTHGGRHHALVDARANRYAISEADGGEYPAHLHLEKHRRSLALHRLIAEKIRHDPALLDRARENLDRWMAMKPRNRAEPDLIEWRSAIDQGIDATIALMTDPGEHATELRQSAPFTRVLTNDERHAFLAGWRARNPRPITVKLPMKTVTLGVDSEQIASTRFAAAMKGEAQGNFITFASAALLLKTLTEPRWQILRAMIGVGPQSLGEVAQRVRRDAEALQDDVRVLLDTGVLERNAEGAIVFPYDGMHVDFTLIAPHN